MEGDLTPIHLTEGVGSMAIPTANFLSYTGDRDSFMLDILCSVVESSHSVLPMAGGSKARQNKSGLSPGNVPGWEESVEPLREDAKFWHATWVSAGKPHHGDLHTAMARSRNFYHYGVRKARRHADLVKAKKLFEASLTSDMDLSK